MSLNIDIDKFYLPENIKYTTHWLNSMLYKTRIEKSFGPTNENMNELPQQTYIRNYFNINSPYRGILLFHGLGTGKSCTSITTAEGLKNKHHIFVMTPASLQVNWEDEIINKCGDINYMNNSNLFYKHYTLIKYNSSDISKIYTKYLYNNYIGDTIEFIYNNKNYTGTIIDVEGNFTKNDYSVSKFKIDISLKNKDIDNKDIDNKDIDNKDIDKDDILEVDNKDIKILIDKNKNVFSNKVVIVDEVHNLISMYKKDDIEYTSDVVIYRNKTYTDLIECINSKIILLSGTPIINNIIELKYILNILHGYNTFISIKLNILENKIINIGELKQYLLDYNKYINAIDIKYEKSIININILKLIDYFKKQDNYVVKTNYLYTIKNLIDDVSELIMLYFSKNKIEYNVLDISPVNKRKFIETNDFDFEQMFIDKEYTETFDIEITDIKNILYLKTLLIGKISYLQSEKATQKYEHNLHLPMEADQFTIYNIEREKEIAYGIKAGKKMDDTSKLRASSRQMCLIGIKGINEDAEDKNKQKMIETFLKKITTKNLQKTYQLIRNYSIKYYTLINILNDKKNENYLDGKVIIYSEYREYGVKLIALLLDIYGYKSIISYFGDINKYFIGEKLSEEGKINIKNNLELIKNHYKVYGVYNASTDSKHIRENRFMKYLYDLEENDDGKYMRILFITKSGSEGLSFKSVRQIHIIDPFWNLTRKRQVIGRGIRFGSHDRLPTNMRNVHVYNYIASFPTNITLSDNIKKYDKELTTDEYILKNSTKKQIVIDKLFNIFKSVSIDCPYNFDDQYNIKCINYPLDSKDNITTYNPFTLSVNKQEKVIKKAKLININKTNYICYNYNIYDYTIYKQNNSYIQIGTYKINGDNIDFKILDKPVVSIKIDIKTFNNYGTYGNINKDDKIYIDKLTQGSQIELNNIKGIITNKTDRYILIEYEDTEIEKKYIYKDNSGHYIIKHN